MAELIDLTRLETGAKYAFEYGEKRGPQQRGQFLWIEDLVKMTRAQVEKQIGEPLTDENIKQLVEYAPNLCLGEEA